MPAKSTKSSLKWLQCVNCGLILLKSSLDQHKTCDSDELPHTHVFKNELATNSLIEHPKDIDKEMGLAIEFIFDFVFLNPITMKVCNFNIGDYVVMVMSNHDSSHKMVKCWPLASLDVDKISLSKVYLTTNQVKLVKCTTQMSLSSLNLKLIDEKSLKINLLNEDYEYLSEHMANIYLNKLILCDQLLNCSYFGQNLTFKIIGFNVNQQKSNEINDLINDFQVGVTLDDLKNGDKFIDTNLKAVKSFFKHSFESYLIDKHTKISIKNSDLSKESQSNTKPILTFDDIGGLKDEIQLLKELFIYPFENIQLYREIGVKISKGILLHGLSGCGKTLLSKTLCAQAKCHVIEMNCSDVFSRNYGESEIKLRELFEKAWLNTPSIIYIDELDTICSERKSLHDSEKRLVSLFSNLMDESHERGVSFLATTNKLDQIDVALRRPARFDKEIEIQIPNIREREEILRIHISTLKNNLQKDDLSSISQCCHGYVGADLKILVTEAANNCIRRLMRDENEPRGVTKQDFNVALHKVKPSAMRAISFDIPQVKWSDIGGQEDLKKKLQQAILWPIKYSKSFERLAIKAPRGLLMYGPPGCSKTMIAKALATETGLNFIAVKGPELFSKYVGESERAVREIFQKARNAAPAIIFFDEIDALASERSTGESKSGGGGGAGVGDRVLATLLNEIDGVENLNDVTIVAATNRPDMIDRALMRPGRLDRLVYVKLPDESTRREIFKIKFKKMPISENVHIDELVELTERYSGAELTALCNEAAYLALDLDVETREVKRDDFIKALELVRPRISDETIRYFDNFSLK